MKKHYPSSNKSLLKRKEPLFINGSCIIECPQHILDSSIDLIITDPPYGINGDQLHKHYNRDEKHVIEGYNEIPLHKYPEFTRQWMKEAKRILRPGGSMYAVSGHSNLKDILIAIDELGFNLVNHIIWKYNFGVYTTKKYITSHYHILYCTSPGGPVTFNTYSRFGKTEKGDQGEAKNYRDREDVWIINREYKPGKAKNKNELPMELLKKMILYSSNEGDTVCDLFLGGFSTAKAAVGLNRKACGFEINEKVYEHGMNEMLKIAPGYLMDTLPIPEDNHLTNQGKPWTPEDYDHLVKRYDELFGQTKKKRKTIDTLSLELGRGYFSILNALKKMGR